MDFINSIEDFISKFNIKTDEYSSDISIDLSSYSITFENVDFSKYNLKHCDLRSCHFINCNFKGICIQYCNLIMSVFKNCNFNHTYFVLNSFECSSFLNCDLSYLTIGYCNFNEISIKECNAEKLNRLDDYSIKFINTNTDSIIGFDMKCPSTDEFIGWKKAKYTENGDDSFKEHECIIKLLIPADSKRSSATSNKCRCSKAKVLSIYDVNGNPIDSKFLTIFSYYNHSFEYKVGETVEVKDFDDNRWNECSNGIHFFMNMEEAINYLSF